MSFAARTLADAGASGPVVWVPVTHQYLTVGTFTETIPGAVDTGGPSQLVIEVGGPGGGGAFSALLPQIGGSGGSGSLCRTTLPLTPANWGQTFRAVIQTGGAGGSSGATDGLGGGTCTIVNVSFPQVVNMQAGGGRGGLTARSVPGAGGVASGGGTNINGNAGQGGGAGGVGITGNVVTSGAGGGASTVSGANGAPGRAGSAAFAYT